MSRKTSTDGSAIRLGGEEIYKHSGPFRTTFCVGAVEEIVIDDQGAD